MENSLEGLAVRVQSLIEIPDRCFRKEKGRTWIRHAELEDVPFSFAVSLIPPASMAKFSNRS